MSTNSTEPPVETRSRGPKAVACDLCHLWKRGCDKEQPSCSRCKHLKVKCRYNRSGPEPTAARKPEGVRTYAKRKKQNKENQRVLKFSSSCERINNIKNNETNISRSNPETNLMNEEFCPFELDLRPSSNENFKSDIMEENTSIPNTMATNPSVDKLTNLNSPIYRSRQILQRSRLPTCNEMILQDLIFSSHKPSSFYPSFNKPFVLVQSGALSSMLKKPARNQVMDNSFIDLLCRLNYKHTKSKPTLVWSDKNSSYFCTGSSIVSGFLRENFQMAKPSMPTSSLDLPSTVSVPIITQISPLLQKKLIEIYFICLNNYYPIIYPQDFYLELSKEKRTLEVEALICAVCLLGSSFYPSRSLSKGLSIFLSCCLKKHINAIYNHPSLQLVQICALMSYHISASDKNPFNFSAWFYLGLGQRMAVGLGLHHTRTSKINLGTQVSSHTVWVLILNEILINHCTGLPSSRTYEITSPFPDKKYFVNPIDCNSSQMMSTFGLRISPKNNAKFFNFFCSYVQLLSKVNKDEEIRTSSLEIQYILDNSASSLSMDSSKRRSKSLEKQFFELYISNSKFTLEERLSGLFLKAPSPVDPIATKIYIYFLMALIDINKRSVIKGDLDLASILPYLRMEKELSYEGYASQFPVNKCIVLSYLGMSAIKNSGTRVSNIAAPYFWYCVVQFSFFISLTVNQKTCPFEVSQVYLDFAKELLKSNSDRWEVIRDSYILACSFDGFR